MPHPVSPAAVHSVRIHWLAEPITTLKQWHPSHPPKFHASFQHAHTHTTPHWRTNQTIPSPDLKSTRLKPLRRGNHDASSFNTRALYGWQQMQFHYHQYHAACMTQTDPGATERKQKKKEKGKREGGRQSVSHLPSYDRASLVTATEGEPSIRQRTTERPNARSNT